jgi:hypothetical protein
VIEILVKNDGGAVFPSEPGRDGRGHVQVGNHWRHADGTLMAMDDGRAPLPHDLKPGESVRVMLPVKLPGTVANYIVEVDLVQEGYAWFQHQGGAPLTWNVHVAPPPKINPVVGPRGANGKQAPQAKGRKLDVGLRVHATSLDTVHRAIEAGGARILHEEDDDWAGPGFQSRHFTVQKL